MLMAPVPESVVGLKIMDTGELIKWRSARPVPGPRTSHEVLYQNFLMVGGSKETRLCTF